MPFFDFVFLRETGLNQYKKKCKQNIRWQARTKIFCKDEEEEKNVRNIFLFFYDVLFVGFCCLLLSTCTVYIRRVCLCEIAGRWTSLIGMDEWRLLVCLFFSFFFPPIFRFASLNSPTMPFARVNRVERLYKFRCVCVSACVWIGILIRVVRLAEIPRRWNESTRNNFILLYSGPSCKSYSLLSILFFLSLNSLQDRRQQQKQTFGRVASFT